MKITRADDHSATLIVSDGAASVAINEDIAQYFFDMGAEAQRKKIPAFFSSASEEFAKPDFQAELRKKVEG